jgi:hypothetical protein
MLEVDRIANNKTKLFELYPAFRTRIDVVLKELEQAGYRPRIQTAWRSPAEQLDAYRRGTSKVMYGFHNVTSSAGIKESLATDILDDDNPTTTKVAFMLHLAAAAEARGLVTGIRWDLKDEDMVLIDIALQNKNWDAKVRVGWDPLHVEPMGITIMEAKGGKRPDFSQTPPPVDPAPPPEPPPPPRPKKHFRVQDVDTNESVEYSNWSTAFKPVTLLPVPYVTQLGPGAEAHQNDCGAACAVMLIEAYTNTALTPNQFYTKFNISGDPYLSVPTIRDAMGKLGVLTSFKAGMTMADLFNTLATGKPVIVLIRYKALEDLGLTEKHFEGPHFAVMVGMDPKYIYLHDPLYTNVTNGEAHAYPLDAFWKAWNDVALDANFPNPARAAIIPAVGLGYPMERAVIVNIPTLNVRLGPALGSAVVGALKKGQVVKITREVNGWGLIDTDRWIYLAYTLPAS